jgi:hypothetical protein
MDKRTDLSQLTTEELETELAQRRSRERVAEDSYAVEVGLEAEAHQYVATQLDAYYAAREATQTTASQPCPRCGQLCRVRRPRVQRTIQSLHGVHVLRRHYHYCTRCRTGWFPLDLALGLPDAGDVTARLEQVVLDLGLHGPFAEAAERCALHHGVALSENLVRRVIDRVGRCAQAQTDLGARLRPAAAEVPATLVVQVDGSMLPTRGPDPWREVKVGLVTRSDHIVANKQRGLITEARFVARLGDLDGFKTALTEALHLERAWECPRVVVVGDGAPWVWGLADELCPGAIQILDYPHALEHAVTAAQVLFPPESGLDRVFVATIERQLNAGQVDEVVRELEACAFTARGRDRPALIDLARYYRTHATRMRYDRYRALGLPCGSGAIESAHRHVVQKRMKLAGQHWDPLRADRFVGLRAALATCGPRRLHAAIRSDLRRTGSYD